MGKFACETSATLSTVPEGRVIKINKAIDCPGEAREDWKIIQDIAHALKRPHGLSSAPEAGKFYAEWHECKRDAEAIIEEPVGCAGGEPPCYQHLFEGL